MPKISPSEAGNKYRSGVQGGAQDYTLGIQSVTEAPSAKAIAQKQKMVTNWNAAINSGKWETKLGAVTLAQWKQAATTRGAQNYAQSADAASQKWTTWAQTAFPIIQNIQDEIKAMPSTTLNDNIQRMITNVTLMAERLG